MLHLWPVGKACIKGLQRRPRSPVAELVAKESVLLGGASHNGRPGPPTQPAPSRPQQSSVRRVPATSNPPLRESTRYNCRRACKDPRPKDPSAYGKPSKLMTTTNERAKAQTPRQTVLQPMCPHRAT